jgi:hypothetical protein
VLAGCRLDEVVIIREVRRLRGRDVARLYCCVDEDECVSSFEIASTYHERPVGIITSFL